MSLFILLSPSKSLNYQRNTTSHFSLTPAHYLGAAAKLVDQLRLMSVADIQKLMKISEKLAILNHMRYQKWSMQASDEHNKAALFVFDGHVYEGLSASTLTVDALCFMQKHLFILSGLYGILRPFNRIQAHRLEMGIHLKTSETCLNLYDYWRERITSFLNDICIEKTHHNHTKSFLINLASEEYFKAIDTKKLRATVITPVFQDKTVSGEYKIVGLYAKRARGLMARWIAENEANNPIDLQQAVLEGYAYTGSDPTDVNRWLFQRSAKK